MSNATRDVDQIPAGCSESGIPDPEVAEPVSADVSQPDLDQNRPNPQTESSVSGHQNSPAFEDSNQLINSVSRCTPLSVIPL